MYCPKCKAKIGIHRYESRTLSHVAQGMTCCMCGYWIESVTGSAGIARQSRRALRR